MVNAIKRKWSMRKVLKRSVMALAVFFVLIFFTGYFLLEFRLKETIKFLVNNETEGKYQLKIGFSDYQFWEDRIELKNVSLKSLSKERKGVKSIFLKRVYIQVDAVYPIVFGQDYHIKKMIVEGIELKIYLKKTGEKVSFKDELNSINKSLAKIGGEFHMENIHIINANVSFYLRDKQFRLRKMKLDINQFYFNKYTQNYAAVFNLSMPHQRLSIKNKLIVFDKLALSNNRGLSLKNFKIVSPSSLHDGKFDLLKVDRFQFLIEPSFFTNSDFTIDSLYLSRVALNYHMRNKPISDEIDTLQNEFNQKFLFDVFDNIRVHHMHVNKLQLNFSNYNGNNNKIALKQKSFIINDLLLSEKKGVSCGRLKLLDDQFSIRTKDKTQALSFTEFGFQNNTISLLNPQFKNLRKGNNIAMLVEKITFVDLDVQKALDLKFHAKSIQLFKPFVKRQNNDSFEKLDRFDLNKLNESFQQEIVKIFQFLETEKVELHQGKIYLQNQSKIVSINNINLAFKTENITRIKNVIDLNKNFYYLRIGSLELNDGTNQLEVNNCVLSFPKKKHHFGLLNFKNQHVELKSKNLGINKFDINAFFESKDVKIEKFSVEKLFVKVSADNNESKDKNLPNLSVDSIFFRETQFELNKNGEKQLSFHVDSTKLLGAVLTNSELTWKQSDIRATSIFIKDIDDDIDLKIGTFRSIDKLFRVRNIHLSNTHGNNDFNVTVTSVLFNFKEQKLNKTKLEFSSILFPKSEIEVDLGTLNDMKNVKPKKVNKDRSFIPEIKADEIRFENIQLKTRLHEKKYQFVSDLEVNMSLNNFQKKAGKIPEKLKDIDLSYDFNFEIIGSVNNIHYNDVMGSIDTLTIQNSKAINHTNIVSFIEDPVLISDFIRGKITGIKAQTKQYRLGLNQVLWRSRKEQVQLFGLKLIPKKSREDFFAERQNESVYFQILNGDISVNRVSMHEVIKEKKFHFSSIDVENLLVDLSKDKTKPLLEDKVKPMFTDLLMNSNYDFEIPVIHLKNIHLPFVEKHQEKDGYIPIDLSEINGAIYNVKSQPNQSDSLTLDAHFNLNGIPIGKFFYRESYLDTLSAFRLRVALGKTDLRRLNSISQPFASIEILSGSCDTFATTIHGNKLAAYGYLNFKYNDLVIHIDSNDNIKNNLLIGIINYAVNDFLLLNENKKPAFVFSERNPYRMVINLWIKSIISGLFTSTGIKSNRKYYRRIKKNREKFYL